jgi:hypothetical protein
MTEDSETVTCPADGCDYDGFRSRVLGHYSGSQDDAHSGGYQVAKDRLNEQDDSTYGSASEASETDTDASQSNPGGSPVMGDADPDAAAEPASKDVELPCGHESYDPGEAPDPPFAVSCSECGKAWEVQE